MAVPKKKVLKSKSRPVLKFKKSSYHVCTHCKSLKKKHAVCYVCGNRTSFKE